MYTTLTLTKTFAETPLVAETVQIISYGEKIKDWIESNMFYSNQHFIWNIGISDSTDIFAIEKTIKQEMTCKYWKCWRAENFSQAMETVREVNKLPFVFKSSHNHYLSKGQYIFIYQTLVPKNCKLFHTLRF